MNDAITGDMLRAIQKTGLFDAEWYKARYPDVEMTYLDPLDHYIRYGGVIDRPASPFFDSGRYIRRHGLDQETSPLLHFLFELCDLQTESVERTIARLGKRLWGGFSRSARRDIGILLADPCLKAPGKGLAAFELARWHMVRQEWREALTLFEIVRDHNRPLFKRRACELLYMETCLALQDMANTDEVINKTYRSDADNALLMLRSNILLRSGITGHQRLDLMNTIYRRAGLSAIALTDPAGPFFFANLGFRSPAQGSVDGPKVSILMPVYNGGAYIEMAIRSLLSQTWRNIEIVAVDDCSQDDSWQHLTRLAATDGRLHIHRSAVNHGAYPSRNMALELATGDFITVHDSDDWSHPQMIEMQIRGLTEVPGRKATCSIMARVSADMKFNLRPQNPTPSLLQRSFPSLLIRRSDLAILGQWDTVSAAADSELIQRIGVLWGADAVADVLPDVPLSFFLTHEASLTQAKGTSLNSLTFGIRQDYARLATHWRKRQSQTQSLAGPDLVMKRTSTKHPFPIPMGLAPKSWQRNHSYDLVIISDFAQQDETLRTTRAYVRVAETLGLRIGLFHWPRYDLPMAEIAEDYLEMCYRDGIDMLVPEDTVSARLILILHPQSLADPLDAVPAIQAGNLAILADTPPKEIWSLRTAQYDPTTVTETCRKLFGQEPHWIAASPRIAHDLRITRGSGPALQDIWFPPFDAAIPDRAVIPADLGSDRAIRLGRHVRDHWTQWPARVPTTRAVYCAGITGLELYLRGAVTSVVRKLAAKDIPWPDNWKPEDPADRPLADFLRDIDIFVHFPHEDHSVRIDHPMLEAMAAGRVVILPPRFADICEEGALYCNAADVSGLARSLWNDSAAYQRQAEAGLAFLRLHSGPDLVKARLIRLIGDAQPTGRG